jgi:hypothetical protein
MRETTGTDGGFGAAGALGFGVEWTSAVELSACAVAVDGCGAAAGFEAGSCSDSGINSDSAMIARWTPARSVDGRDVTALR